MADTGNVNVDELERSIAYTLHWCDEHFTGKNLHLAATNMRTALSELSDLAARARVAGKWESDYVDCVERAEADRDRLALRVAELEQEAAAAQLNVSSLQETIVRERGRVAELEAARGAIVLALPDHGGACDGTDDAPAEFDPRGDDEFPIKNPCIRCRVLRAYDSALAGDGGGA